MNRKEERQMGRIAGMVVLAMFLGLAIGLLGSGKPEGLPELHLQKIVLDPPSPVTRGEVVAVHAWVMNTGGRPAGEFKVEFFYRPQGGESWTSFYVVLAANLTPSKQEALEIADDGRAITFDTSSLELGTYEIRVVADSNDRIPEKDETNNELVTTLTVLPSKLGLPDLQPVALSFDPPSPTGDQLVVVSTEIRNTGDKDAGPFRVTFLANGREFDSASLEGLAVGARVSAQGALDPYALGLGPGSHRLLVVVDADERLEEQDEANNQLITSLTIQGAELRPKSLEFDKPLLRLDGRAIVSSTVVNTGKGAAETVEVGFYIDGRQFALVQLGPLGKGEEGVAQGELIPTDPELGLTPGAHEIRAVIDPNNLVPELDEANNELVKALTILPPEPKLAELHPESLEINPPSPIELGRTEVATVSSVIKNTGKSPAEDFAVELGYRVKGSLRWNPLPCRDQLSCTGLTLVPGEELRVAGNFTLSGITPGVYEIRVVVDGELGSDSGRIEELDETNNELFTTLTLLSPRLPDLGFDPVSPLIVAPSYQVAHGQTLRFTANLINLGDTSAGPFEVEFAYCRLPEVVPEGATEQPCTESSDFSTFSLTHLPGLGVNNRAQSQAILETTTLPPGSYLIRTSIDPADQSRPAGRVKEQSEVNNLIDTTVVIQGADLIPIDLQLRPPSPVVQGEVVQVTATVVNTGVEPTGKFDVTFYWCRKASEASCVRPSEFASFGGVAFPGIAVNNPESATGELDTATLEPGEYLLRVVVDPDDRVEEQSELNNELTAALQVEPRPADLRPEPQLIFEPQPPVSAGQPVKVYGGITNDGGTAAEEFNVAFLYRKVEEGVAYEFSEFDRVSLPGLAPGEAAPVMGVLNTAELRGGTYEICLLADPDDVVPELDETNNRYCTPPPFVVIGPEGKADLALADLAIKPSPILRQGQTAHVMAKIANRGKGPAGPFAVQFFYQYRPRAGGDPESILFATKRLSGLEVGETVTLQVNLTTGKLSYGDYTITAVVDGADEVRELDETNNQAERILTII